LKIDIVIVQCNSAFAYYCLKEELLYLRKKEVRKD